KERISALMTDAIRANVLEYCGYQTQLLEFVDLAHSPKNVLIRAVRGNGSAAKRERAKKEIEQLQAAFQLEQTLAKLVL
ncbi:MAG: SAM-dependent methyltransferase, partial [Lachnospiraceae bacterium]|nr:SAM-dependent methyltransferase [Lachnospiraceae bacterium]